MASVLIGWAGAATITVAALLGTSDVNAADQSLLRMAANASGRPKECAPERTATGQRRLTVWAQARQPQLGRYCDLLARAQTTLREQPAVARDAAMLADQVLPGRAAPWVLRARTSAAMGDFKHAVEEFDRAQQIDRRSLEQPEAMHDLATALRHTGHLDRAMQTYRMLVPRVMLLPTVDEQVKVFLEAASVLMLQPNGQSEAIALLTEARRMPMSSFDLDVAAMLALALARGGELQQAAALITELQRLGAASTLGARPLESFEYLADPIEAHALRALALEPVKPQAAAEEWKAFIERCNDDLRQQHARQRLQALQRGGARTVARL